LIFATTSNYFLDETLFEFAPGSLTDIPLLSMLSQSSIFDYSTSCFWLKEIPSI